MQATPRRPRCTGHHTAVYPVGPLWQNPGMSRFAILLLVLATTDLDAFAQPLIRVTDDWAYFKGITEPSPANAWKLVGFDDSSWPRGPMGFSAGAHNEATPLHDMFGVYNSVFLRRQFVVTNRADIAWLYLRLDVEDGAVVYLNGAEVHRIGLAGNVGTGVPFNTAAANRDRTAPDDIDISTSLANLVNGTNVLAIQVHSSGVLDGNLACIAELLANFSRGPIIQSVTTNSAKVLWKTGSNLTGRVEFGLASTAEQSVSLPADSTVQIAMLPQLQPGTNYVYRVVVSDGIRTGRSTISSIATAPTNGITRFSALGDSGNGGLTQYAVAASLRTWNPDLVLHLGDVIYPAFSNSLADIRCLSVYQRQMASTPYYFTFGNHDLYSNDDGPYLNSFALPTNSASGTSHYYSFDHGDVHFVSVFLPTLTPFSQQTAHGLAVGSTQYNWLTNDLATTSRRWKVLFFHAPMNTSSAHRYDDLNGNGTYDRFEISAMLDPVCERYGVQLVLNGHDHNYERFRPKGALTRIVSGGGGYPLYGMVERDPESVWFQSVHHHLRVTVDGDWMKTEAVATDGTVIDSTTIPRMPPVPGADSDGDGLTDEQELAAGTDPRDAASTMKLQLANQPTGPLLWWKSIPGRRYDLQVATNAPVSFTSAGPAFPRTSQTTNETFIDLGATNSARFYRLNVGP